MLGGPSRCEEAPGDHFTPAAWGRQAKTAAPPAVACGRDGGGPPFPVAALGPCLPCLCPRVDRPALGRSTLTAFCVSHPEADARAYWNYPAAGDPRSTRVFFLTGGGLVLGLSVAARDQWLEELRSFTGTEHGHWTGECPPEDTVAEFVAVTQETRSRRR